MYVHNHVYLINMYKQDLAFIIIMSHGYSWSSLARPSYRPLLSADPQGYILYRHRAAVCIFELDVLPLDKPDTRDTAGDVGTSS